MQRQVAMCVTACQSRIFASNLCIVIKPTFKPPEKIRLVSCVVRTAESVLVLIIWVSIIMGACVGRLIDSLMHDVVPHLPLEETQFKRARGANAHSPAPQQKLAAWRAAQARVDGSAWSLTKELSEMGEFCTPQRSSNYTLL